MRARGHEVSLIGDGDVARTAAHMGFAAEAMAPEYDLGPALVGAVRNAMSQAEGDAAVNW